MKYAAIDIGNVCIAIEKTAPFKGMGLPVEQGNIPGLAECVAAFEFGQIGEEEFFRRLTALPYCKNISVERAAELYDSILLHPVPGMPELLCSLPEMGVTPVFFSDISTFHLEGSRKRFPEMRNFEGIYSFDYGAYKPSPILFEAFEKKYGKPVIYTDDRSDLIEGAEKYGWNAHCFRSAEILKLEIIRILDK